VLPEICVLLSLLPTLLLFSLVLRQHLYAFAEQSDRVLNEIYVLELAVHLAFGELETNYMLLQNLMSAKRNITEVWVTLKLYSHILTQ
jgi:hypothetical protein